MADEAVTGETGAEAVVPLGTRGRPGRGTGRARPSASSRGLGVTSKAAKAGKTSKTGSASPKESPTPKAATAAPKPTRRAAAERATKSSARPAEPLLPESTESAESAATERTTDAVVTPIGAARSRTRAQAAPDPLGGDAEPPVQEHAQARSEPTAGIAAEEWLAAFVGAAREMFGEQWEPRLAEFLAFLRRRLTGDYAIDEFGFDAELTQRFVMTALRPIAQKWFRIEVRGIENIPRAGGALVVSNHSGTVPMDALMTMVTVHDHAQRFLRPLGADLVFRMPVVSEIARRTGATLACNEDAERMLRGGELVGVWPEGFKGIGKPFSERYKLQRFGRGGFVSAAMRTGVPIIPVSVVGAEEIYPLVGNVPSLARLLGVPYVPITPFFPLLGPLGMVPLPSKWLIEFGEPVRTDSYEPGAADDPMLVFNVTDQVRETIQQTLYKLLLERPHPFRAGD